RETAMSEKKTGKMTRREALAASMAAAGLAAANGVAAAAASRAQMKVGCGTVTFRKRPLKEALERIRRAGYEYAEPQAVGPWCPHVNVWEDDPAEFRRLVTDFGFRGATALWAPHGAIIPDAKSVDGITRSIRWAKEAGIPVVNAGDGVKPKEMSDEEAFKLLRDRLAQILEVAELCRVYLAIEPHGTYSLTADGLKQIMALSDSKWLGINYDTANVHRVTYAQGAPGAYRWPAYGKRQDEVTTLKAVVDRVVHVHVKDVVGAKCVALGQGTVNIIGCLRVLKKHGYTGVLSLETEGNLDPESGQRLIEASRTYLMKALAAD
ncbi:MAG TPA: sugar phosphate isomerase/epimerase, partial [Planctomycetaceae bacterium]|nr:sugar phosphate isomerase/epimerase [Planctomycetaceae bacterium]